MSNIGVEIKGDLEKILAIDKQVEFAAARTLTEVAKQGQEGSVRAIQSTFTTRGRWFLPSNRFGVKVKAARKGDLESSVRTAADWLIPHETGGLKRAGSGNLAIPIVGTGTARPRFSSKVRGALKPRALGGKAFIIQTKSGPVLFYRRGKKQRLTALYNIETGARLRKQSVIVEPTVKVVRRRFDSIFEKNLREAIATAGHSRG